LQATLFARHVSVDRTAVFDMPVAHYWLASGRRKRRVDARALAAALDAALAHAGAPAGAVGAGDCALADCTSSAQADSPGWTECGTRLPLDIVLERPTPIPDIDGWQSAALSGAHCPWRCLLRRLLCQQGFHASVMAERVGAPELQACFAFCKSRASFLKGLAINSQTAAAHTTGFPDARR
jgi:hypothetical protein